MRLIPGKTKVGFELFKGLSLKNLVIYIITAILIICVLVSNLPYKPYIAIGILILAVFLSVKLDSDPGYVLLMNALSYLTLRRGFKRASTDEALIKEAKATEQTLTEDSIVEAAANAAISATEVEKQPTETDSKGNKTKKKSKKSEKNKKIADKPVEAPAPKLTKAEIKAKEKEEKAAAEARKKEKAEEDRLLKSSDTPEDVRNAIKEKRKAQYAESAAKIAAQKDATAKREPMQEVIAFTNIKNDLIEYGKSYYGAVLEIPPVEFRFFSSHRRNNAIENGLGRVLRSVRSNYGVNIVKLDRPMNYEAYLDNEYAKLEELRASYESGFISEEELKTRVEIMYDRIYELRNLCYENRVVSAFYYVVLFDSDIQQLNMHMNNAIETLRGGELNPRRLNSKELAVFLKYSNEIDFDEHEIDELKPEQYAEWARPKVIDLKPRTVQVNRIVTHNAVVSSYPSTVGDAWLASVMSVPSTKVVVKCSPMDSTKSIKSIDQSLQELRSRQMETSVDSKLIELQTHIDTLTTLLTMLQGDNEILMNCNVYVTAYDIERTRNDTSIVQPPKSLRPIVSDMKRTVRRTYTEENMKLNFMDFNQHKAFVGSQISGYDPFRNTTGRGMPSNTIAAMFPWIFAYVSDKKGVKLGSSDGVPVFIDFFRRDSERVNSNMVIVGKSGSGKSYATKSLLSNLAADDAKIFILDPENEYSDLAQNLHGKFINVGNAQYGRLNPFHIITALDDDEAGADGEKSSGGSYSTHLQFLEEFFRQILPDCEKDALEYLNSLIDRMYINHGISEETDLSKLKPEDYPIFDDLYDTILNEFQRTDNDYIRSMLRTLVNYIAKFSAGGRNAAIWDGPSTITTEENFTVFNFQSLLSNRNGTIANAQMLLVLKYVDNEIIKNRDYNIKYGLNRKVVVVIDEAHVFIDAKYPIALDFMFQLAKRIRKYNGMQLVITQNIKDFVGSEEIARKSTAIINACQYSFIFALAPNDMDDLCKLYEKAGGINENEQEQIVSAPRGHAFTIMGPQSRSSFSVEVPDGLVELFQEKKPTSKYFAGMKGQENWEDFLKDSREKREKNLPEKQTAKLENSAKQNKKSILFEEIEEDDFTDTGRNNVLPADFFDDEEVELSAPIEQSTGSKRVQFSVCSDEEYAEEQKRQKESEVPATASISTPEAAIAAPPVSESAAVPVQAVSPVTGEIMGEMVAEMRNMVENLTRLSYEGMEERVKAIVERMIPAANSNESVGTGFAAEASHPEAAAEESTDFVQAEEMFTDEVELEEDDDFGIEEDDTFGIEEKDEEEDDIWGSFDSPWDSDETISLDDAESTEDEADSYVSTDDDTFDEDDDFDELLDELIDATGSTKAKSRIELMDIYGDAVVEITLMDLADYITSHAKSGL